MFCIFYALQVTPYLYNYINVRNPRAIAENFVLFLLELLPTEGRPNIYWLFYVKMSALWGFSIFFVLRYLCENVFYYFIYTENFKPLVEKHHGNCKQEKVEVFILF